MRIINLSHDQKRCVFFGALVKQPTAPIQIDLFNFFIPASIGFALAWSRDHDQKLFAPPKTAIL